MAINTTAPTDQVNAAARSSMTGDDHRAFATAEIWICGERVKDVTTHPPLLHGPDARAVRRLTSGAPGC
jgi:hypothetical protein